MKLILFFLLLSTVCFSQVDTNNTAFTDNLTYDQLKQMVVDNNLLLEDNIKRHTYAGKYYRSASYNYIGSFLLSIGGSALITFGTESESLQTVGYIVGGVGLAFGLNGMLLTSRGNKIIYYR